MVISITQGCTGTLLKVFPDIRPLILITRYLGFPNIRYPAGYAAAISGVGPKKVLVAVPAKYSSTGTGT